MAVKADVRVDMGNLAEEWMQGNARVRMYDGGYANKMQEEIKKVDERFSELCCEFYAFAITAEKKK